MLTKCPWTTIIMPVFWHSIRLIWKSSSSWTCYVCWQDVLDFDVDYNHASFLTQHWFIDELVIMNMVCVCWQDVFGHWCRPPLCQWETCHLDIMLTMIMHMVCVYSMSMDADAKRSQSCQLETRHWVITDEDGHEEVVDGPGVIGESCLSIFLTLTALQHRQFSILTAGAKLGCHL